MDEKSLGIKLSNLIFEHDPGVERLDPEACAKAANVVAGLLGCLVASIAICNPQRYDEIIEAVNLVLARTASKMVANAMAMQRERGPA